MALWRKSLAVMTLSAVAVGSGFLGVGLVRDVQFSHAQQEVETSRENLAKIEDLATVFRNVGKVVEPSVVNIQATKSVSSARRAPYDEEQLRRNFPDQDGDGEPDLPPGFDMEPSPMTGTGSGVIVEVSNGVAYIVTNNHVAGDASELIVMLADGRQIENATLVGADAKTDVAVIRIEADRLIPAKWGNSDEIDRGDWVLAFGSPFGYIGSMTHGIVSALDRQVGILEQGHGYENFIQVDAPINPGNSGGPLVNIRGEIVGINTAIASRSGGFQGIGFAIPSNQAKFVYEQLKEKGKVTRGYLGVSISDVSSQPDLAESYGHKTKDGVMIHEVLPGTPSYGTLKYGDIILSCNGRPTKTSQQLRAEIARSAPGTEVTLGVWRDAKTQDIKIKLGELPDEVAAAVNRPGEPAHNSPKANSVMESLGMKLEDSTSERASRFGRKDPPAGALVVSVEPNSIAAKSNIRRGVIITHIGDVEVKSAAEAIAAFEKADLAKGVRVYLNAPPPLGSRLEYLKLGK